MGLSIIALILILVSAPYAYAYITPFPIINFDFTLTSSTTLVRMQPEASGTAVIWVNLFCPNSTLTIRCDPTVLQYITLKVDSGCPSASYCMLDRTTILVPPLYGAGSNLIIYSFSTSTSGVTTITVTGIDQFGNSHSTQFGVVVCYC